MLLTVRFYCFMIHHQTNVNYGFVYNTKKIAQSITNFMIYNRIEIVEIKNGKNLKNNSLDMKITRKCFKIKGEEKIRKKIENDG